MTERLDTEIYGDDDEQTYRLTLADATQPLDLHLQTASGGIEVYPTDDDMIEVTISPDGGSQDEAVARLTWDGRRLAVRPVRSKGRVIRRHGDYEVDVRVPRRLLGAGPGVTGRCESASGDVSVGELTGDLIVMTASGELDLNQLAGRVEAQSASGGISLSGMRGWLKASAASGDISVHDAIVTEARISGVSGDIDGAIVLAGDGPFEINAVSASIDLDLGILSDGRAPRRWELAVKTLSGSVEVDGAAERRERRKWVLGTGDGQSGSISISTVSGDIEVRAGPAKIDGVLDGVTVPPRPARSDRDDRTDDEDALDVGDIHVDLRGIADEVQSGIARAIGRIGRHVPPTPPSPPAPPAGATDVAPPVKADAAPFAEATPSVRITTPASAARDEEQERLDILRGLEQGRLSVDEAMARLERLGGG